MKSERRHKLQQNALAHSLENLPKMGRESGSKLLLGIVTVLLVFVLVRYYFNNQQQKKDTIASNLSSARIALGNLAGEPADKRKAALENIDQKVSAVLAEATDPPSLAQAKNLLADAYVQVAALGDPPEATTRPDVALPKKVDGLLDDAAQNYQAVLDMKDAPVTEVVNARFGLGAIAEDRQEWDKARGCYQAVANDPGMPKAFTSYANFRMEVLDKISKPIIMGTPVEELRLPPGLSTSRPATNPATVPTTGPAGPATQPTTAPAAVPTTVPSTLPTTLPTTP